MKDEKKHFFELTVYNENIVVDIITYVTCIVI